MVTVVGCCPEDITADEAPVNKLGDAEDASEDTFEDSSVINVLENELGSASISEHCSRKELFWWRLLPAPTMILLKTTL